VQRHYSCKGTTRAKALLVQRHYSCKGTTRAKALLVQRHYSCKGTTRAKALLVQRHYSCKGTTRAKALLVQRHFSCKGTNRAKALLVQNFTCLYEGVRVAYWQVACQGCLRAALVFQGLEQHPHQGQSGNRFPSLICPCAHQSVGRVRI
jgi:hypothetical protein